MLLGFLAPCWRGALKNGGKLWNLGEGVSFIFQSQSLPDSDTTHGPLIVHRSVLQYDHFGHIPHVSPSKRQHGAPHGRKGTLGSAKGFGPWTFGLGKVSRSGGEVSRSNGTFKSAPGFEAAIWFRGSKASQLALFVRLVRS